MSSDKEFGTHILSQIIIGFMIGLGSGVIAFWLREIHDTLTLIAETLAILAAAAVT